jgi:transposase
MARPVKVLSAPEDVLSELRRRANGRANPHRERFRAGMILQRLDGVSIGEVAGRLNTSRRTVWERSSRFETSGLAGLEDKGGRGRKPSLPEDKVSTVITEVTRPPKGRTRWSVRGMARYADISSSTVQRIWSRNDLQPHVVRTFKLSNDPKFEEKFWDVIGLYLNPPEKALVLCCDEKSQCQALERSQPGLPLAPRHPRTQTHDYRRHGTVTLFAALNYLEGTLISRTEQHHTHVEWLRFLKQIEGEAPRGLTLHLIADNYATHKHAVVRAWLAKRPRFVVHFTPTGSSWLNLVERFFADLTGDVIRAGGFTSVPNLVRDIKAYLAQRNADPRTYKWKAQGDDILAKIKRARTALNDAPPV